MADSPLPRLLILTSTFPRWPDDHEPPFVFELARRLTRRFEVTVLAPHAPGAKRREQLDGIRVERFRYAPERFERLAYEGGIPARLRRNPWLLPLVPNFVLAMLLAALRLAWSLRPAAVHAHWLIPGGLVGAMLKGFAGPGLRLVVTAHGGDVFGLRDPLSTRLKRWVLGEADQLTVVSGALATAVGDLGADLDRLVVLPMGTDLSTLFVPSRRTPGPPTVAYAGRLVEKKGIDTLLRAAAVARERVHDLKVTIAGHGPLQPELEALGRDLGIDAVARFTGPYAIDELPGIYAAADLAVFPFRAAAGGDQDGFGLAIVEAMGCEVPVVGSDIAPLDDLLVPGVTALRAPVDDVQAFADAIVATLGDPQAARERAREARRRVVERFDWTHIAERYAELIAPGVTRNAAPPRRPGN